MQTETQATNQPLTATTSLDLIRHLETQIQKLRQQQMALGSTTELTLYKIEDDQSAYLKPPTWVVAGAEFELQGHSILSNEEKYIGERPDVAFVVCKFYERASFRLAQKQAHDTDGTMPDPIPSRETIRLCSTKMSDAVKIFLEQQPTFKEDFPKWNFLDSIDSPFLFWYRYRSTGNIASMYEPHRSQMELLSSWIERNYSRTYDEVATNLEKGVVSTLTMPFYIRPGEVIVSLTPQGIRGYIAESWVWRLTERHWDGSAWKESWGVKAWSYSYDDGRFNRLTSKLEVELSFDTEYGGEIDAVKLNLIPLRLAKSELREKLKHRGRMMWACRRRSLVAYDDKADLGGVS
jgi:hypothetical protein